MPRYVAFFKYSAEGARGMMKEKPSGREAAVRSAVEASGGKVELWGWLVSGEYNGLAVFDFPDPGRIAAFTTTVSASGASTDLRSFEILTSAEMDKALAAPSAYRSPGA